MRVIDQFLPNFKSCLTIASRFASGIVSQSMYCSVCVCVCVYVCARVCTYVCVCRNITLLKLT
jgi:hypothetical protein